MRAAPSSNDTAAAMPSKAGRVRPCAASITSLHSQHCKRPNGAPQRGQARHQSTYASAIRQESHSTYPGVSQIAHRVGHTVSAKASAASAAIGAQAPAMFDSIPML